VYAEDCILIPILSTTIMLAVVVCCPHPLLWSFPYSPMLRVYILIAPRHSLAPFLVLTMTHPLVVVIVIVGALKLANSSSTAPLRVLFILLPHLVVFFMFAMLSSFPHYLTSFQDSQHTSASSACSNRHCWCCELNWSCNVPTVIILPQHVTNRNQLRLFPPHALWYLFQRP
jgi:hypothetical protein